MARSGFLLVALALVAHAGDPKEKTVTTTVAQDAAALARGTLTGVVLEKGVLVLPKNTDAGTVEAPVVSAGAAFDRACISVNADLPGDARVEVAARVRLEGGEETDWLPLGVLSAPDDAAGLPRSADPFSSPLASVDIDTVVLPKANGRALSVHLVLRRSSKGETPRVRRAVLAAWPHAIRDEEKKGKHPAWGKVLSLAPRSQRVEDSKISMKICSPTSLSMVLSFWGIDRETKAVCAEVLDRKAQIYGNWALNVAFAGRLGLEAEIARMGSFEPLEAEIAAGRPVVITHRWQAGELTGAPVASSDGHLIVVRGLTRDGDLEVSDPAAPPGSVERVYKRAEIAKTWLERGDGVAYLIRAPKK